MLKQVSPVDGYQLERATPAAFDGATSGARGDKDGALAALKLYYVTGDVVLKIFGVCSTLLASTTGTLEVGVSGNTAALIAQTTATDIDANELWNDATPAVGTDTYANITGPHIVVNGTDIIETTATADISSGQIYYVCIWAPLTPGAKVEANHLS